MAAVADDAAAHLSRELVIRALLRALPTLDEDAVHGLLEAAAATASPPLLRELAYKAAAPRKLHELREYVETLVVQFCGILWNSAEFCGILQNFAEFCGVSLKGWLNKGLLLNIFEED
eukprot:9486620-Pyramimonas_sp.AAC.1